MNFIEEKIIRKISDGKFDKPKLRFPPEPNAESLHIGHAKSICLNFGISEKYNGTCNLRFDDTNPSAEKSAYVEGIIENILWLGFKPNEVLYTSDYFSFIYDKAITLIEKGLAYIDDSSSDEIALMKGTPTLPGMDSPYRERTIKENLDLFNKMKLGEFEEGSKVLRAKIDMSSTNMLLRDPILYRIINKSHHHVGDMWKIYPMYDFAHPLSDYNEGITDSLCTLEFEIHKPLYMWVLENCDLPNNLPEETEFARLNMDYTVMSKRKLKILVDDKIVSGFDDPRLPTISGLRRRGYTAKSIRDFCEIISVTRNDSVISHKLLEEILRGDLNKTANRYMGVMDPIKLIITNWDKGTEYVEIENNPGNLDAGKRLVPFSKELWIESEDFNLNPNNKYHRLKLGGEVRLKGAYVVKANEVIMDGDKVKEVLCTYDPLTKSGMEMTRKIKGTIHYVSVEHGVNVSVNEYEALFTSESPDMDEDFTKGINPNSLVVNNKAIFEPHVIGIKDPIQMIRKGYYILDKDGVSFNKTVSLKDGYTK